jgi:hypothetical protein
MNKNERRYKAKRAILNVLTGAGYEFLIDEFGVDDGSEIHNEVKAIIDDMADKLYNPQPRSPRKPRTKQAAAAEHGVTGGSEPIARYEPDTSNLNRRGRYGRNEGT